MKGLFCIPWCWCTSFYIWLQTCWRKRSRDVGSQFNEMKALEEGCQGLPKESNLVPSKQKLAISIHGSVRGREKEIASIIEEAMQEKLLVDWSSNQTDVGISLYCVPGRLEVETALKNIEEMKSTSLYLITSEWTLLAFAVSHEYLILPNVWSWTVVVDSCHWPENFRSFKTDTKHFWNQIVFYSWSYYPIYVWFYLRMFSPRITGEMTERVDWCWPLHWQVHRPFVLWCRPI